MTANRFITNRVSSARCNIRGQRRGVASVLAMMFLVIFSSLAAAMAVVAQSNLRTADSGVKLSRAMSSAETGMTFATKRLAEESARFVVEKGVIDEDFAEDLWLGTVDESTDGVVEILQPDGYTTGPGIIHAIRDAHLIDGHNITVSGGPSTPELDEEHGTLRVPAIALNAEDNPPYFILTYELLDNVPYVRVTSVGVDADVRRTLQMDFRIDKKIEFAILSPNRIMIGKNVLIEGPLGSRFGLVAGELDSANGDPLIMRSDFYYLNPTLNAKLDTLYAQVVAHDVDGDARLRPDHPTENAGLSGQPDLVDYDGDEYVDDFDLFLAQFDTNSDLKVDGSEFDDVDDQMFRLLDRANADRDYDGELTPSDTLLGYNDGYLDYRDMYAKVRGRMGFAVARSPWDTANEASYQTVVQGPVRSDIDIAPVTFEVTDAEMREITTSMFDVSQAWFTDKATGDLAAQSGSGGTVTDPSDATWEQVPFGASGAYDHYKRKIYDGFTFTNVRIPKNTNALFKNCKFVGVTYVETETLCTDVNWNYAGAVEKKVNEVPPGSGTFITTYPLKFPTITATLGPDTVADTRAESNNIRFDGCTFLGSLSGDKPAEYTHWRNKIQMTGSTRFYIDPEDADLEAQPDATTLKNLLLTITDDDRAEMEKSSILMPGWSIDVGNFNNQQAADPTLTPKIKLKGTIIAGIMDIRGTAEVFGTLLMTFRPASGQGPLYYGGLPDAFNTTIGYFGPLDGDGEGIDPSSGAFTGFGEITLRYNPDAKLPDGIPWPVRIDPDPLTYFE
jgi:hypothetical protein